VSVAVTSTASNPRNGRCTHAACKCQRYEGQDPENQLIELRRYAKTLKPESVVEYIDRETGKHSDRDAFQELFQDASRRKFGLVLVWALDRLSREGDSRDAPTSEAPQRLWRPVRELHRAPVSHHRTGR